MPFRHLFAAIALVSSLTCCTFSLLPPVPTKDPNRPVVVPAEVPVSAPQDVGIKFHPPVETPEEGRMWVCAAVEGDFLCIDYGIFHQIMLEEEGKRSRIQL